MGKYKRLLSNTAILGAGTFTSKVLVFLLTRLYTACLTESEYGFSNILTQTAQLLIPLAVLGLSDGLFRFVLDSNDSEKKAAFSTCISFFVIGMLPLAGGLQFLRIFSRYDGYIWLIFLYICAANFHSICANYLRALGKTTAFAIQGIANTILVIAFNVLFLVKWDMGILGYVVSVPIADLIVTVAIIFICKLYKDFKPKLINKKQIKDLLKFSLPYIPTTIMWTITLSSDHLMVAAMHGDAQDGLYQAAYKLPTIITLAGTVFMEAWHFSSVSDATNEERGRFFEGVYKNYTGLMFMGTSLLIFMSQFLSSLLLAPAYHVAWEYVPVLSIAMIFSAFSSFMGSVYFIEKRSMRSFVTAGICAGANIVLNCLLIPKFAAMGAAIATAVSYMIAFAVRSYDTKKYLDFNLYIPKIIINTIAIITQAVMMIWHPSFWWIYQIAIFIFILIFNGNEIVRSMSMVLKKIFKKGKKI